jgi:hypothetical protein
LDEVPTVSITSCTSPQAFSENWDGPSLRTRLSKVDLLTLLGRWRI